MHNLNSIWPFRHPHFTECHILYLVILQICTVKPFWYPPDFVSGSALCTACRRLNKNVTVTEECSSASLISKRQPELCCYGGQARAEVISCSLTMFTKKLILNGKYFYLYMYMLLIQGRWHLVVSWILQGLISLTFFSPSPSTHISCLTVPPRKEINGNTWKLLPVLRISQVISGS